MTLEGQGLKLLEFVLSSLHSVGGIRSTTQKTAKDERKTQRKTQKISKTLKGSPYSITERRIPELIPVLGSQPAVDVSHKPGGRLPILSARPAVTHATLNRAATNFAAW